MAQALGEQGARIFMNARKADEVQQVVAELKARGIEADGIACDLSKPEGNPITTLVDAAEARFGTIDILINNAGTTWGEPAAEHSYRSEEHTSELQSRPHLVCRLLLEK